MKPWARDAGRAALAAALSLIVVLTAACGRMPDRLEGGEPIRPGGNELDRVQHPAACDPGIPAIAAQPLTSYRGGFSNDAGAAPMALSLLYPSQIAASGDDLFIVDQGLGQLVRVQKASQNYRAIARLPGRVTGLFVDPFRKLYMAVPAVSGVLQVSTEGATERVIRDAANLGSPLDVVLDREQLLNVVDGSDARVIVFDRLGQQTGALGERLDTPNLFATTDALAVGRNGVYVLDATLRRLHLFHHGRAQATHDLSAQARAPSAIAVDGWERIFVLDHGPERVLMLTDIMAPEAVTVSNLGMTQPILDLWVDEMGVLYLAEQGAVRSFRLPPPCKG